jgi:flavin reductase (DIM6/NTAB) family NADH-FMN oxidoreductase RutF
MENFKEKAYKIFEMFDQQWAIVTGGSIDNFNSCTLSWGSLGNIWGREGKTCPIVTVYVHPARYTSEFLTDSDYFTVSFYPEEYRKAVAYMGSHSGRDEDKAKATGLTPVVMGEGVTYQEANLTFLCKKLYQHQFSKEDLAPEIQDFYASKPEVFPAANGDWQPHLVFVGEIIDCKE